MSSSEWIAYFKMVGNIAAVRLIHGRSTGTILFCNDIETLPFSSIPTRDFNEWSEFFANCFITPNCGSIIIAVPQIIQRFVTVEQKANVRTMFVSHPALLCSHS